MGVFYGTLILTYVFSLMSRLERKNKIVALFFVAFTALTIILVAGLRNSIGDTELYMYSYRLLNSYTFSFKGDWGFGLFQAFLYKYISKDPQILIFVTALITNLLNIKELYNYCSYLELQVYMYITSGYFTVTMNGIRQSLVAAVLFVATKLIEEGKFKEYLLLVLLMSTYHQSALIMIPVYFIVRSEAWSKTTISIIGISSVVLLGFSAIFPVVLDSLKDTNYGYYANNLNGMGGSTFMRVIVNMVPVILAYITRDKLKELWPQSNIFVNMALMNVIFVTFGMYNWIFNRLTIYFQLYNFVLVPYIIKNCLKVKERRLVYYCFIICFFIFFYKEQVLGFDMKYSSRYFIKSYMHPEAY